jgi:choline kinase
VGELVGIVLAAGVGSRLRPLTNDRPKCLVSLGRETILARAVRVLGECGVGRLVVATGYRARAVRSALRNSPMPVTFVDNPDYENTQNLVSLSRALQTVTPGERLVKLDGDVVFAQDLLAGLLARAAPGLVAVDCSAPPDAEAMKVASAQGRVRRFGKTLAPRDAAGESIGIEAFAPEAVRALTQASARLVAAGRTDAYYEDMYNEVLDQVEMLAVEVAPQGWIEVDDPSDLARARERFG